ncbi:hypothetical protein R0137_11030 [Congregibacter brevis]|uniref:Serine aminopeptidase, S33 n=1 Tax=Congregibacter brevis TaxID=3081201 RepID=A0ABZ0IBK0_9GAMM|nr:hypothetical protein R0137_11030 [Congregibacter sp. IMCC45268]
MPSTRVEVTLIHGTWPYGLFSWRKLFRRNPAGWHQLDSNVTSSIDEKLRSHGIDATFSSIKWSGRNSFLARFRASLALRKLIAKVKRDDPSLPHFLVAHSHGGNVAMQALRKISDGKRPVGLVTIATPFIVLDRRSASDFDRFIFGCFKAFGVFAFYALGVFFLVAGFAGLVSLNVWLSLAGLISCWLGSSIVFDSDSMSDRWLRKTIYASNSKAGNRLVDASESKSINPTSILVLRAVADEASIVLGAASMLQLLENFIRRLIALPYDVFEWVVKEAASKPWTVKSEGLDSWALWVRWISTCGGVVTLLAFLLYSTGVTVLDHFLGPDDAARAISAFDVIFGAVVFYGIAWITLSLVQAFAQTAFGMEYLSVAWRVEIHAEPLPDVDDPEFQLVAIQGKSLRHSIQHTAEAHEKIADWIAKKCISSSTLRMRASS